MKVMNVELRLKKNPASVYFYELLEFLEKECSNDLEKRLSILRQFISYPINREMLEKFHLFTCTTEEMIDPFLPSEGLRKNVEDVSMCAVNFVSFVKKTLPYFVIGSSKFLEKDAKRLALWCQHLESMTEKEAVLVLMMKDKQFLFEHLSKDEIAMVLGEK